MVVQSNNSLKGKQEAFKINLQTVSNGKISMTLNLLENQNNIEPFTNKPINLFIDNYWSPPIQYGSNPLMPYSPQPWIEGGPSHWHWSM